MKQEKDNALLTQKELFTRIFGEDQFEYLKNGRVKKWSDETIRKSLKLRFAAGTRGKFLLLMYIKKSFYSGLEPLG